MEAMKYLLVLLRISNASGFLCRELHSCKQPPQSKKTLLYKNVLLFAKFSTNVLLSRFYL